MTDRANAPQKAKFPMYLTYPMYVCMHVRMYVCRINNVVGSWYYVTRYSCPSTAPAQWTT